MPDIGKLSIMVASNGMTMPIEGATVRLYNDNNKILEEMKTDENGHTIEIELKTPPVEYSQEMPNIDNIKKPYSTYNISIEADGFETKIINEIQILPDTTALQRGELNQNKMAMQNNVEVYDVLPHTLYKEFPEKTPEDFIKELPPPTGFVVLDKVVVPETIVVHDGLPDDANAKNYYVPFRDYIKNVASCEIYANWPDASIKSNILAILSFTLNRIFTEWYRNKGKNFNITTSTSYDQAYSHNRNIFVEINTAVDEIFTSFITKPDIKQPLFAQYCDGVRVKREGWLSQWGSKDLADKGYNYTDILKNYYGSNIYIDHAVKVSGIPQSFPGYNLTVGSSGDNVRIIQNQLNKIANNYPAIPKLAADGIFGQSTSNSIKKFQEIFSMPINGIVDFATWYKISSIYVAVEKLAA